MVRAVEGKPHLYLGIIWRESGAGCVRKHQAAGTRCGVPEHYHCTALLYSTVTTGYYSIYPHGQL